MMPVESFILIQFLKRCFQIERCISQERIYLVFFLNKLILKSDLKEEFWMLNVELNNLYKHQLKNKTKKKEKTE